MYELFMDIPGYEGLYQVSNIGNVKSLEYVATHKNGRPYTYKERILKPSKDNHGYMYVKLFKDGKGRNFKVHRLVMLTFKANPDNKPEVNHIDEDKTNNKLNNLEWCTSKENNNHGTRLERLTETCSEKGIYNKMRKINMKKVICVETGVIYESAVEVAKAYDLYSGAHIAKCCKNQKYTAKGLHWKYYEGDNDEPAE